MFMNVMPIRQIRNQQEPQRNGAEKYAQPFAFARMVAQLSGDEEKRRQRREDSFTREEQPDAERTAQMPDYLSVVRPPIEQLGPRAIQMLYSQRV